MSDEQKLQKKMKDEQKKVITYFESKLQRPLKIWHRDPKFLNPALVSYNIFNTICYWKIGIFYSCKFAKVFREFDDLKAKNLNHSHTVHSISGVARVLGAWRQILAPGGKTWRPGTKLAAVKKLDDLFCASSIFSQLAISIFGVLLNLNLAPLAHGAWGQLSPLLP